ncbi:MAG TPA: SDR family oxidoreductase, partial [Candidatus Wirthbacteria bacterium]|nr:SDR family oxidoreductase [Candidatus Wirthbacteria bacterium]
CRVVVNYYPIPAMQKDAEDLVASWSGGAGGLAIGADLTKLEQVGDMFAKIEQELGHLDIVVNNAGVLKDRTLAKMTPEEWQQVLDVNLQAAFFVAKYALPLLQMGSSLIGISSISGVYGNFGQSNYAASKAGLIGFYKSLAKELGPKGIRVNCIAPGLVESPMSEQIPQEARDLMIKKTPLRRLGRPEDIAQAVCFLASRQASYITGHVLHVDGGLSF